MTVLPYWRAAQWRHPPVEPLLPGRKVATIWGVPCYVTAGALVYPAIMVPMLVVGLVGWVLVGPAWFALAAGVDASLVAGVIPHELAHGVMARRMGQTVGSARITGGGACVVWGAAGETISPCSLAVVAAAGPLTNLAVAVVALIPVLVTRGAVAAFFLPVSLLNAVSFLGNALPIPARRRPGQRRVGTDGFIVARAVHAARTGPTRVDMLSPRVPLADVARTGTAAIGG